MKVPGIAMDMEKPNVIVIVSDTLRWDALAANGGPGWLDIKTPELDDFASRSACFDFARVSSFPTIPMRTDCFTGRFSHPRYGWQELERGITTLPQLFSGAGYTTQLLADTTHLLRSCFWRTFRHFDFLRGHESDTPVSQLNNPPTRIVSDPRKTRVERNRTFEEPTIGDTHARDNDWWRYESDRLNSRICEKACHWLEDNFKGGPFFLWLDCFDPHEPWDPPEYLWRMYHKGYDGEPMTHPNYGSSDAYTDDELANLRAHYAGEATLVSKNIGRVLRLIDDTGLMENSVVSVLSDHGIFVGERGRAGKSLIAPGVFDAFPQNTEISHLVWMMNIPGAEPGRYQNIVQPPDLMPTLLEACEIDIPDNVEGRSLMPTIRGEEDTKAPEVAISTWTMPTHFSDELVFCRRPAVTDGEWTLVLQEPPEPETPQLFHISEDPGEREDLIMEEPGVARDLFSRMISWLVDMETPAGAIDRLKKVDWSA